MRGSAGAGSSPTWCRWCDSPSNRTTSSCRSRTRSRQLCRGWLQAQEQAGRVFTPEQLAWLDRIRDTIASSLAVSSLTGFRLLALRRGTCSINQEPKIFSGYSSSLPSKWRPLNLIDHVALVPPEEGSRGGEDSLVRDLQSWLQRKWSGASAVARSYDPEPRSSATVNYFDGEADANTMNPARRPARAWAATLGVLPLAWS